METSENSGGQSRVEAQTKGAADGAGQPDCDTHRVTARPEPKGGQGSLDTQRSTAANGDERAKLIVTSKGDLPAVADPIERETGDGHVADETHPPAAITNGGGQRGRDTHASSAPADPTSSGQEISDAQLSRAAAGDEAGQRVAETQRVGAGLIAELIAQHRQHEGIHRAEKSLTLQIKANCRHLCKGDKTAANELYAEIMGTFAAHVRAAQKVLKAEAKKAGLDAVSVFFIRRQLLDNRDFGEIMHPLGYLFWGVNLTYLKGRNGFESDRLDIGNRMEEIVAQFPVAEWWCSETGRNLLGLAQIIGETGNLWNYDLPGMLWSRLGLWVDDGKAPKRQRGVDNHYNARRRSVSWRIADSLFKGQSEQVDKETGEVKREAGRYRVLYDKRKIIEIEKAVAQGLKVVPAAKIPKGKGAEYRSDGHIHKLSMRYVEKRLLKHLWQIWRGTIPVEDLSFELGGQSSSETHRAVAV